MKYENAYSILKGNIFIAYLPQIIHSYRINNFEDDEILRLLKIMEIYDDEDDLISNCGWLGKSVVST